MDKAPRESPSELTVYGSTTCEDTQRVEARLRDLQIPYTFVDVDHDAESGEMIAEWNGGHMKTPTVVLGAGERPRLIEPSNEGLDEALIQRGLINRPKLL